MSERDKIRYKCDITLQNHYATKVMEFESVEKKHAILANQVIQKHAKIIGFQKNSVGKKIPNKCQN